MKRNGFNRLSDGSGSRKPLKRLNQRGGLETGLKAPVLVRSRNTDHK